MPDNTFEKLSHRTSRKDSPAKAMGNAGQGAFLLNESPYYEKFIIPLFLIVATFLVYKDIGGYEFVNFDDPHYVYENSNIRDGLTLKNISWALTSFYGANWHPMTWLSHMLDIELFGLHAGCHHLVSLGIHICNSLLLYLLFFKTTKDIHKSAVLAAMFALHPIHVESVAWIAERKDLLCAFFWIVAMLAYSGYAQKPSLGRYLAVFFLFLLGSMSKPMMVTFPFALLLFDYWPLQRLADDRKKSSPFIKAWTGLVLEKIPLIIVASALSYVTLLAQSQGGAMGKISLITRITNGLTSYALYMKKVVWPLDLAVLYPIAAPSGLLVVFSVVLLFLLLGFAFISHRQHPYLIFGYLWYLGTLVPVIGIVQVGSQAMADRYMYIPSIGFFAALVWGGAALIDRFIIEKFLRAVLFPCIPATIFVLMIFVSYHQVHYWRDSITLMTNAVRVTKNNYIAHENLGLALTHRGFFEEGLLHFQRVITINPNSANAYMNIGSYFLLHGEYDRAIDYYHKAIQLDGDLPKVNTLLDKAMKAKKDNKSNIIEN